MAGERIFTRDFTLDTIISFCCSLNYFTLLINITGFASLEFGADPAAGGTAAGIYVIGGLISRVLIGKYVELIGRKKLLIAGLALALVMSASYFLVTSMLMLYAVRFVHGMAYGLSSTCTSDIVAKLVPPGRRGEGLGYFFLSITFACAIGPLLGMTLGASEDYDAVFTVGLVMYTIALLLALAIRVPEETLTEEQAAEARSFRPSSLFQRSALPLAMTVMVFYFAYSGVLSFISDYAEEIGMVEAATYFYLAVAAGTLVSRIYAGRIYDAKGPNAVMLPAYLGFMVGMAIFATTSSAALFLASGFVIGIGVSIVFSICQSIVVSKSPPRRYGVTTSTFSALNDLGTGVGPTVLGVLITAVGYRYMYLTCVFVAFVSLLMYWFIHGRRYGGMPGREIRQESD
ncbi:MAG: MFS transporter [Thermoplasmata archaeon]|nr:MFS transporter [Thermoplasmata archaeon]